MNVVSFGGGTNSTAMIVGMYLHKIPVDLILFADPGAEQPHTYEYIEVFDEWLVKHIGENPYLQYFIGMKAYSPCPFEASTLVAFRKRFGEEELAAIPEPSIPKPEAKEKADPDDGKNIRAPSFFIAYFLQMRYTGKN